MRPLSRLAFGSACAAAAILLILVANLPAAWAQDAKPSQSAPCTCPPSEHQPRLWPRPKYAHQGLGLDESDEIAALEAIRVALSEVGDGSTYVWHRPHGRLSGMVQPTGSFKDIAGKVCRHIVLMLSADGHSGKTEGIACRLPDGRWQLDE